MPGYSGKRNLSHEPYSKLMKLGVYVGKHLNFGCIRKVVRGNSMVANPAVAGEIRPSGMTLGACGNVGDGSRTEAHREICGFATEP